MLNSPQAQALLLQHQPVATSESQSVGAEGHAGKRTAETPAGRGRASKRGRGRGAAAAQAHGGSNDDLSSTRAQMLQEKNRRAQRRFRERQKAKVSELLIEVEELSSRVEGLQADKQSLTHHSNILQKVLGMKEEQLETMMQRLKTLDGHDPSTPKSETLEVVDSDGAVITITRSGMQDKLSKIWREFVNKLAGCLVEGGAHSPGEEIIETINKLVADAVCMYKKAALYDPPAMRKWFLCNMEDPTLHQHESEVQVREHFCYAATCLFSIGAFTLRQPPCTQVKWKCIVRSLALTAQQKEEIAELKKMRAERLHELERDALNLAGGILESEPSGDKPVAAAPATGRMLSQRYIRHCEIAAKLRDNVLERGSAQLEFDSTLFQGIFTSLQMARVMVQSYPLVPDSVALVDWACQ